MSAPARARIAAVCALALIAGTARAACPVRSAYDVTVTPHALIFDSNSGAPRRIEMRRGALYDRGRAVALDRADRNRIVRFERVARDLVPRIRGLGTRAVDLMAAAVREEARATSPEAASSPELNRRLEARVSELKARIAASTTSKDWHGNAFNRYVANALTDVVPLVGGDLAGEAFDAALRGEFARAAELGERAAGIKAALERRIRARLDALQPDVERLCPAVRQLDGLERDVSARLADGTRLNLLQVGS